MEADRSCRSALSHSEARMAQATGSMEILTRALLRHRWLVFVCLKGWSCGFDLAGWLYGCSILALSNLRACVSCRWPRFAHCNHYAWGHPSTLNNRSRPCQCIALWPGTRGLLDRRLCLLMNGFVCLGGGCGPAEPCGTRRATTSGCPSAMRGMPTGSKTAKHWKWCDDPWDFIH